MNESGAVFPSLSPFLHSLCSEDENIRPRSQFYIFHCSTQAKLYIIRGQFRHRHCFDFTCLHRYQFCKQPAMLWLCLGDGFHSFVSVTWRRPLFLKAGHEWAQQRHATPCTHVFFACVLCCRIGIFNLISNYDKNGGQWKEVRHH